MQVEVIETTGGNIFNQLLFSISSLIPLVMYGLIIYILIQSQMRMRKMVSQ